ncbi:serine hydrolase domain-containing protein, partial [Halalkalibaculum sp. DA384]|uniref:serine hydrolase domain-containing protein n=1 Tax=Halalkalibaculum sp. DA384 TaxID=3373606 RepID=UPI003754E4E1
IHDSTATFYGAVRTNDTLKTIDNKSSVFEIGSLSKVFTAALLADLATENKLQLDQPIQAHLDFPLHDSLQITFKQLANHTSGLPRIPSGFVWESLWHMDNPYKEYDEDKLRKYMGNEIELAGEPGTSWQYSNIGAGILGYTLTQIEDQSYEEMLQQRVFNPLGMQHSTTRREL